VQVTDWEGNRHKPLGQEASMNTSTTSHVIRLSARDLELLFAGLDWIVGNCNLYRTKGQVFHGRPDLRWNQNLNKGIYDQRLLERMLALHATIRSLKVGGRLRMATPVEFAVCSLAVRVAVTRHRHGHRLLDIAGVDSASGRLLRRLETVRKRAKRAEVRRLGAGGYQEAAHAWREFSTWLRVHLLDCSCKCKRRSSPLRGRRVLVTQFSEWARDELIDRKHKVPDNRELRRLVRLGLRYVRRGRSRFILRDLLNDKITTAAHFANFVILHDEKTERKKIRYEQRKQNAKTYSSPWSEAD
jgi:hypothetical protein